jgi:Flp pilus assembly protein TadG
LPVFPAADSDVHWSRGSVRRFARGQSIVEFALVAPVFLLLVIAIADFGRLYTSAVAVEAAAREAADYGSFHATYWETAPVDNRSVIVALMEKRACTAAAGSHLEGYTEPVGTIDHATCTNPSFSYSLEPDVPSCSDPLASPCIVHVRMDYDFSMILGISPLPATLHLGRDSRFQMQDLTAP